MCSNRSMGLERALKQVKVNNRLSRKQHFNILLKNQKATICEKKKIKRKLRVEYQILS